MALGRGKKKVFQLCRIERYGCGEMAAELTPQLGWRYVFPLRFKELVPRQNHHIRCQDKGQERVCPEPEGAGWLFPRLPDELASSDQGSRAERVWTPATRRWRCTWSLTLIPARSRNRWVHCFLSLDSGTAVWILEILMQSVILSAQEQELAYLLVWLVKTLFSLKYCLWELGWSMMVLFLASPFL